MLKNYTVNEKGELVTSVTTESKVPAASRHRALIKRKADCEQQFAEIDAEIAEIESLVPGITTQE